jgi:hypothetical protein
MLKPIVAGAGALAVALPVALAGSGVSAKEVNFCFKTGNGKNYLAVDRRSGFPHAKATSCSGDAVFAVDYPNLNPNSPPRMSVPMVIRAANGRYIVYYGLRMRAMGTAAQVKDAKQRARMMMLPRGSHKNIRGGTPLAAGMQIGIYPTITRSRMMLTALAGGGRDIRNAARGNPRAPQNFYTLTAAGGPATAAAKPRPLPWKGMPGKALDVGVGGGQAWVVGTDGAAYHWNGKTFEKRGGGEILRMDVGPRGLPWVVTKKREIFRFDGRGFRKLPGLALDIGVSGDGGAWVVGTDGAAYQWTGKTWTKRGGENLARIDATLKGGAIATDRGGNILRFAGGKWGRLPGKARDISGGGGQLWSVGADRSPGGMTVNRWDGKGNWILYQGGIVNVAVDGKGMPWATNGQQSIYSHAKSAALAPKPMGAPGGGDAAKVEALKKRVALMKASMAKHDQAMQQTKQQAETLNKKLAAMSQQSKKMAEAMKRAEAELKKAMGQ